MKQSGTTVIFVIVWVVVLLAAYGIGLCIREVRFRSAGTEPKAAAEPQMRAQIQKPISTSEPERERAEMVQVPPEMRPMPGREGGPREGMAMFQMLPPEEAAELRERWPNMSEEEREQFRAQMAERWENMSEEEKQQAIERRRAEMRERFGDRRPQGGRPGRRQRQNE